MTSRSFPLNLNTNCARPMGDVGNVKSSSKWTFKAVASTLLKTTTPGLEPNVTVYAKGPDLKPTHDVNAPTHNPSVPACDNEFALT
jgi:hypothetical protein